MGKTNEQFLSEAYNLVGDEYEFLEEYVNSQKKILCKHKNTGCQYEWLVIPNNFLRGSRCPQCNGGVKRSPQEFANKMHKLVGDEYSIVGKYINARTHILIKHRTCGKEYNVRPDDFTTKGNRCTKCSGYEHKNNEKFTKEVFELVGSEYTFLENYVNAKTELKIIHNSCGTEYKTRPNNFLSGKRCPQCKGLSISKAKLTTDEEFKVIVYEKTKGRYFPNGKYRNVHEKMLMTHNVCGSKYLVTPSSFLYHDSRCPVCHPPKNKLKSHEEFVKEVKALTNNEYLVLGRYINAKTKIFIRHEECNHNYKVLPDDFTSKGSRCPKCNFSKGEKSVSLILESFNIKFTPQFKFDDCKNIRPLPFDFYLDDLNVCIEFDGKQHFEMVKVFGGASGFKKTQINDQIKNDYCFENNIPLLRIPYWESENIEHILFDFLVEHGALEEIIV